MRNIVNSTLWLNAAYLKGSHDWRDLGTKSWHHYQCMVLCIIPLWKILKQLLLIYSDITDSSNLFFKLLYTAANWHMNLIKAVVAVFAKLNTFFIEKWKIVSLFQHFWREIYLRLTFNTALSILKWYDYSILTYFMTVWSLDQRIHHCITE